MHADVQSCARGGLQGRAPKGVHGEINSGLVSLGKATSVVVGEKYPESAPPAGSGRFRDPAPAARHRHAYAHARALRRDDVHYDAV